MKNHQLSQYISPIHYDLFFAPDLEKFTFKGKTTIEILILKPTSEIVLNSSELNIKSAIIKAKNETFIPKISLSKETETLVLSLSKKILNSATIEIEFEGILNDKLSGFYRSQYKYDNKIKYLATTQFEAPYARKAFPCFDQPDKKATFSLSLLIQKNLKAISNMPIISQKTQNNKSIITFQKTPIMSTYLLYIGIGEFEFLETKYKNKIIRIATTPGKSKEGAFALDLTKKFLSYFENFSKILYPLPKLDLIAIPDFNAGAMENWGAITFREILLLFNPKKTSLIVKKRIAEVIAHELWHQWSGNLVTMKWWDDLWLNESFATYMAYKAVSHFFPQWNMWDDFISDSTGGAFSADMRKSTHAIAVKVKSPNEIEEIFDEISYGKGGSVLRMIESYLSPQIFQKGVSNYLKRYKYKNAQASDLWNSLSQVSNAPIKQIMESWINQPGHPLISVAKKNNSLYITQQRLNSSEKSVWKIPLTIKTNSNTIKILLDKKTQHIELKEDIEWFKLNDGQKGFYRTKYEKENLNKLSKAIQQKKLSNFDRWGILNDLFTLSRLNIIPISDLLDFLLNYKNETNPLVLEEIAVSTISIYQIFSQSPHWNKIWNKFSNHINQPFQIALSQLSWDPKKNESANASLLRSLAISYLSFVENKSTIKTGFDKFNQFLKDSSSLHPDIKGAVFGIVGKYGNNRYYNKVLYKYKKTQTIEEKIKLLASLYRSKNHEILKKSLDFALTPNVRLQDLRTVFAAINSNPNARPILFTWIKQNWNKLKEFKTASFVFMAIIESLITSYTGKQNEQIIKKFLNEKKVAFKQTQAQSFETMQINTSWFNKNENILINYFK